MGKGLALLALLVAMLSTTPGDIARASGVISRAWLPSVTTGGSLKGSAGVYADGTSQQAGVNWGYGYFQAYHVNTDAPIEIVPMIQLSSTDYHTPFVVDYAGQYWLLGNEVDNADTQYSDNITPAQGAVVLHTVAAQLPTARIVCCGLLHGPAWLDAMLTAYQTTYSANGLDKLAGVSFHDYATLGANCVDDACYLSNWTAHARAWLEWRAHKLGAYPVRDLQLWLTEAGWTPEGEPDWATAVRHMQLLCDTMRGLSLARYAWYSGIFPSWNTAQASIALFDVAKQLTPLGIAYRDTC